MIFVTYPHHVYHVANRFQTLLYWSFRDSKKILISVFRMNGRQIFTSKIHSWKGQSVQVLRLRQIKTKGSSPIFYKLIQIEISSIDWKLDTDWQKARNIASTVYISTSAVGIRPLLLLVAWSSRKQANVLKLSWQQIIQIKEPYIKKRQKKPLKIPLSLLSSHIFQSQNSMCLKCAGFLHFFCKEFSVICE